jgi:hypothetical protein
MLLLDASVNSGEIVAKELDYRLLLHGRNRTKIASENVQMRNGKSLRRRKRSPLSAKMAKRGTSNVLVENIRAHAFTSM